MKALFDTNILVDFLNGVDEARGEIQRYDDVAISIISWMEVLVGAAPATEAATRAFLASFALVGLDQAIAYGAVALRRAHRVKLPDAIVWSSARVQGRLLVTRNTKDFPAADPGIRAPYVI